MTASSTIPAPAFTIICPDWCTTPGQHDLADLQLCDAGEDYGIVGGIAPFCDHPGPVFGPFVTGGQQNVLTGDTCAFVDVDIEVIKRINCMADTHLPEALQHLEEHTRAARLWLEAQQSARSAVA